VQFSANTIVGKSEVVLPLTQRGAARLQRRLTRLVSAATSWPRSYQLVFSVAATLANADDIHVLSGGGPRAALRAVIPEFEKRIAGSRQLNGASLVDIGVLSLAPKADIGSVDIDQHGRTVAVLSSTR
jgi:hypothetical protein